MRKDFVGAEAVYRAAMAADPGNATAHAHLGLLSKTVQEDFVGPEVAYRAAIAADPGNATAHNNPSVLLGNKLKDSCKGLRRRGRGAPHGDRGGSRLRRRAHRPPQPAVHIARKDVDGAEAYRTAIAADPGCEGAH